MKTSLLKRLIKLDEYVIQIGICEEVSNWKKKRSQKIRAKEKKRYIDLDLFIEPPSKRFFFREG